MRIESGFVPLLLTLSGFWLIGIVLMAFCLWRIDYNQKEIKNASVKKKVILKRNIYIMHLIFYWMLIWELFLTYRGVFEIVEYSNR